MTVFRIFLIVIATAIGLYTVPVVAKHGLFSLFPQFFGDIAAGAWPGQFNLDFLGFLVMSATWLAWRHRFGPAGLLIGLGGLLLGAPYLCTYLLIQSFRTPDIATLFLGLSRV